MVHKIRDVLQGRGRGELLETSLNQRDMLLEKHTNKNWTSIYCTLGPLEIQNGRRFNKACAGKLEPLLWRQRCRNLHDLFDWRVHDTAEGRLLCARIVPCCACSKLSLRLESVIIESAPALLANSSSYAALTCKRAKPTSNQASNRPSSNPFYAL
jgi:hypothetical protein